VLVSCSTESSSGSSDEQSKEIDGRFRLEGACAAGGMGTVYRAVDLVTGETVAVKISSSFGSQLDERFQQEANCLATITHPAIVRHIAHGKTIRGEPYLVMEWLDGETLEDRLVHGPIPLGQSVQMLRRVAEALAVAHQHGVIHRDIKPANIFLPGKDMSKIKLLDFGIARRLFDTVSMRLTQAGSAIGTPMYMSPEQVEAALDVDARADVFSLGCVFFECLTGAPPFADASTTGALCQLMTDEAVDVQAKCAGVPSRLTDLLGRMLAKQRDARPGSMAEILVELGKSSEELRTTGVYAVAAKQVRVPNDASMLVADGERRLVAVLVVTAHGAHAPLDESRLDSLARDIAPFGAFLGQLANGSLVVTLTAKAHSTPLDLAVRAARCGLKVKLAHPRSSLGISLGHAIKDGELHAEHLINSAVRLVSQAHAGSIHVSDEIKRLLDARFEIAVEPDGSTRLLFEKGLREAPRTVLGQEIPCLGREREVRELESLFEACVEEPQAQVAILSGDAGCGKSRVVHEFLERLCDSGKSLELLIGRGDPMHVNVSLGLLAQTLRGAAGISGTEPDEIQRKRLLAHTSRFLPAEKAATTAAFLGEIANLHFPDDDLPQLQAARRDARLMADQTLSAWMDWLEAESDHHPVFLLLEDLHWGDFASVNYIDSALRVLRKKPLMVLALARPEVDERFFGLWRGRYVQRISLPPLGKRAGQEFIRRALGEVVPEKMTWLLDHAQGNPFYLEELVRAAASGSDLSQIPDTVLGTVQIRFDAVGEGSKLVLRAASIFGQSFAAAGVKALLGEMSDEDVDRWLQILVDKEILFCRQTGNTYEHVFRHALLHQAAYAMLAPKEEVSGNTLAGHFLEEQGERDAIVLADHFEKGDKPQRAIRWLRVAANQAMAVDDLGAALDRVERGVRLGAGGDDLAELKVVESEARYWKGDYVLAERAARDGRQGADPKLALRALAALTDALGMQAKYEEIAQLGLPLEERPRQPELLNAWLDCKAGLASYLAAAGHYEARESTLALLEQEWDRLDPILIGRAESMRGHLARAEGRPAEALERIRRAQECFDKAGHRRASIEALGNHGIQLLELGLLEEAESDIRSLWAMAERMGLNHLLGGTLYMLSNILAYRGCLDEARSFGEKALAWTIEMNDGHFRRFALLYLIVIENLAANYQGAEQHARAAIEMLAADPSLQPFARALLARALLGQGLIAEAVLQASDAQAQLEAMGSVQDGEPTIRLALVECLVASSDMAAATRLAHQAADKIRKQADTIDNPEWRNSFLTRIPEHRRILELEQQLETAGK